MVCENGMLSGEIECLTCVGRRTAMYVKRVFNQLKHHSNLVDAYAIIIIAPFYHSQNSAAKDGVSGDERQTLLLDAWKGFGRIVGAQHDALRSRQQARLQFVGRAGQPRLVVRGGSSILQEVARSAKSLFGEKQASALDG